MILLSHQDPDLLWIAREALLAEDETPDSYFKDKYRQHRTAKWPAHHVRFDAGPIGVVLADARDLVIVEKAKRSCFNPTFHQPQSPTLSVILNLTFTLILILTLTFTISLFLTLMRTQTLTLSLTHALTPILTQTLPLPLPLHLHLLLPLPLPLLLPLPLPIPLSPPWVLAVRKCHVLCSRGAFVLAGVDWLAGSRERC